MKYEIAQVERYIVLNNLYDSRLTVQGILDVFLSGF